MTNIRILIVASDQPDRARIDALQRRLQDLGHEVSAALRADGHAAEAGRTRPDLALVELRPDGGDGRAAGIEVGEQLARAEVPVVYLIDSEGIDFEGGDFLEQARPTEPYGYLMQPCDARQLRLTIDAALAVSERVSREKAARGHAETELTKTIGILQGQMQLAETVFYGLNEGAVMSTADGRIIANPAAEQIAGTWPTESDTEQEANDGTFHPDGTTRVAEDDLPLARAKRGEMTNDVRLFVRNRKRPDGVYISVNTMPLASDGNGPGGWVMMFRDITEHERTEEALTRAFEQGRLEVVDTILHNIGNAITSVSAGAETMHNQVRDNLLTSRLSALADALEAHRDDWSTYLQSDPQGRQVMPFILALAKDFNDQNERLTRSAERVVGLVNHVVEIIRTQRSYDFESMARKEVDLHQAIAEAVKLLEGSLAKRCIEVAIDCLRAPDTIRTQESRFHQMIVNLVKNSVEAIDALADSGRGATQPRIQVDAYARDGALVIDVIDNGTGIPPDRVTEVFSARYTTKAGGSGLGLHSARNFATGSGGSIQALSDGTTGTTIRVTLPTALSGHGE